MDFAFATEPSPGRANEDHVLVAPGFAIVLDGVTPVPRLDSGCRHGPRWLVRHLGAHLAAQLSTREDGQLSDFLAEAITDTCRAHADTCDLCNPNSPSTTVAIVRHRDAYVDYLVLCDSTVVVDRAGEIIAITDDRTATLPAYDAESVAGLRNQPGGFWVASTVPEAAAEALSGTIPADEVNALMVGTDGVSRLVEFFGWDWVRICRLASEHGPRAVINALRACERAEPARLVRAGRRTKPHDDATLAVATR